MRFRLEFTGVKVIEADTPEEAVSAGRAIFAGDLMDLEVRVLGECEDHTLEPHDTTIHSNFKFR